MTKVWARHRPEGGFTLIEAVLVVTLVSVMGVALAGLFSRGMRQSARSNLLTTAVSLANEKMEEILADKNGKGYPFIDEDNYPDEWTVQGFRGYSRFVSITDTGEHKIIKVRVTHDHMVPVELTTFLTNY